MLRFQIFCSVLLCFLIKLGHTQSPKGWVQVWSEEFDGPTLDDTKWTNQQNNWSVTIPTDMDYAFSTVLDTGDLQYYSTDPSNAYIEDGKLIIQAKRERKDGFLYTSARLTTQTTFNFTYGRIEASVKLPRGQGMQATFGLLGANIDEVGWPACKEIDIMYWNASEPTHISEGIWSTDKALSGTGDFDEDIEDFHTFAAIWEPNRIDIIPDNSSRTTHGPQENETSYEFNDNPMFLVLTLAVRGNVPETSDDLDQQFVIDWVRVYNRSGVEVISVTESPDVNSEDSTESSGSKSEDVQSDALSGSQTFVTNMFFILSFFVYNILI